MKIFYNVFPDGGYEAICQATAAIISRAQENNLLFSTWSLAELQPDNDDFLWLCDWARQLPSGVARRCVMDGRWRKWTIHGKEFSYTTCFGLLLLMFSTEVARRESDERSLWAAIRKREFLETTRVVLFLQGHPTRPCKDALERAAQKLHLRHVFGVEGLQNWYDTISLQFGFSKQSFMRRLPEWLVGQGQTLAIRNLLSGSLASKTFQEIWHGLLDFRRENITEKRVRALLTSSPWILPEWTDDIVRQAKAKIHLGLGYTSLGSSHAQNVEDDDVLEPFLDSPTLKWEPPDGPIFTSRISNLTRLNLTDDIYDIFIAGQLRGHLRRNSDGSYNSFPGSDFTLPMTASLTVANLLTKDGQVIQTLTLKLWNENDDITVYQLSSGQRIDPWEHRMRTSSSYALLISPDLNIAPSPSQWYKMPNVVFYFLMQFWSSDTKVLLEDNLYWEPYLNQSLANPNIMSTQKALEQSIHIYPHDTSKSLSFGKAINFQITHPQDVSITFLRVSNSRLDVRPLDTQRSITEPILLEPSIFTIGEDAKIAVVIGAKRGEKITRIPCGIDVQITSIARLTSDGWKSIAVNSMLGVEQAKLQPLKVFVLDSDQWVLFEGDVGIERLRTRPHSIEMLSGYGAPLTIRKGVYNANPYDGVRKLVNAMCK